MHLTLSLLALLCTATTTNSEHSRIHMTAAASDTITLETPSGKIAGTLVVIIAGSGPTDRNGNSPLLPGANNSLKLLAEGLAERGIASLRYKRGVAASATAMVSEANLRFDIYADDAAAWIKLLRRDPRFSTIAVVGHSEGSTRSSPATPSIRFRRRSHHCFGQAFSRT